MYIDGCLPDRGLCNLSCTSSCGLALDLWHDNTLPFIHVGFLLPHGNPGHDPVHTSATPGMR